MNWKQKILAIGTTIAVGATAAFLAPKTCKMIKPREGGHLEAFLGANGTVNQTWQRLIHGLWGTIVGAFAGLAIESNNSARKELVNEYFNKPFDVTA